jgi:hypothetical protein
MTTKSCDKKRKLSVRVKGLLRERDKFLPIWIRAPKLGHEHFTGLSRSKLYEMAGHGLIRSVSIREPGQVKGSRLFHLASVLDYIGKFENKGD